MVQDSNGYFWYLSPENALPDRAQHLYGPTSGTIYYDGTGCTGNAFLQGTLPPPRVPFSYGNVAEWRVRTDSATFQTIIYRSHQASGGSCVNDVSGGVAAFMLPAAGAPVAPGLSPPALGLTPPLHLERLP